MYECEQCGDDGSVFPEVFLAVNSNMKPYPNHREDTFQVNFNKLYEERPNKDVEHYISDNWKAFWSWLGDNHIKLFCSKECAENYLKELRFKESG
jgi:hypothetical protein